MLFFLLSAGSLSCKSVANVDCTECTGCMRDECGLLCLCSYCSVFILLFSVWCCLYLMLSLLLLLLWCDKFYFCYCNFLLSICTSYTGILLTWNLFIFYRLLPFDENDVNRRRSKRLGSHFYCFMPCKLVVRDKLRQLGMGISAGAEQLKERQDDRLFIIVCVLAFPIILLLLLIWLTWLNEIVEGKLGECVTSRW